MQSVRMQETLTQLVDEAAGAMQAELRSGAEVPFELESQGSRSRSGGTALYCYRPLTGEFISQRMGTIERLPAYAAAARLLGSFAGLDRYLAAAGVVPGRPGAGPREGTALKVLLREVFAEQTDFQLRPERLRAALGKLEQAAAGDGATATLVARLHGMTIISPEVQLTRGLTIARPEAIDGLPEPALAAGGVGGPEHLVAVLTLEEEEPGQALTDGRAVLEDLLRALRLFGDGRVTLGELAWARLAGGGWNVLGLGSGGHPRGVLLVTPDQEDELRAFCSLVSRRAPEGNELAWALRRFELGCERATPYEALTDHLLALRALLEPEGPASGMLPGRLAALCATAQNRLALTERTLQAIALERAVVAGTAIEHAGGESVAADMADHLRALLRDVICGHLDHDVAGLADEILLERDDAAEDPGAVPETSEEQMFGDLGESQEVLDLSV